MENFLYGAAGVVIGTIGTLILPWVKWGLEKIRLRHDERKRFIADIRNIVEDQDFSHEPLIDNSIYFKLKPHLDKQLIEDIEFRGIATAIILGRPSIEIKYRLLDAISKLEREWGII